MYLQCVVYASLKKTEYLLNMNLMETTFSQLM
jgi:hypothetical protein